jgi:hypothetical protein
VEREGDEPVRAGLQMVARTVVEVEAGVQPDVTMAVDEEDVPAAPETLEQRAMRELMITAENGGLEPNLHDDMVIGLQDDTLNLRDMPADETDAYRRDVLTRPEVVSRVWFASSTDANHLRSVDIGRLFRGTDRGIWRSDASRYGLEAGCSANRSWRACSATTTGRSGIRCDGSSRTNR